MDHGEGGLACGFIMELRDPILVIVDLACGKE
jgi:hypothetical protein